MMTPIHAAMNTQDFLHQAHLEQAWLEDQEDHSRLEAELQRLEQRKRELRSEMPVYDSRLRRDARFPDSVAEGAGVATRNDRLSLDGDEPPVR